MTDFDTIVVGLGGAGSSAAYHLSASGHRVLGLEQFGPVHSNGSSHGRTRIYRTVYSEGGAYVPLTQRAQQLWLELENTSGERITQRTGGLYIGRRDTPTVAGALRSAAAFSLEHHVLSPDDVEQRFPQFCLEEDEVAVWDPQAGILFPENCIRAHASATVAAGGQLHYGEAVKGWTADSASVVVRTTEREYRARSLVLTAGPWISQLVSGIRLPLEIVRQFVLWFPASDPTVVVPGRMPVFIWDRNPRIETYGVPDLGDGVKLGAWAGKVATSPEGADRTLREDEAAPVREFVRSSLRGVIPREREWASCLFTMAPDRHFVIGRHPSYSNVLVVSACSGHGFKFTSVLGEVVSRLVDSEEVGYDLSLFRPERFGEGAPTR